MIYTLYKGTDQQTTNLSYATEVVDNSLPEEIDFDSWQETHFEVVKNITQNSLNLTIEKVMSEKGTGGLYELAKDLTNEFEELYKNKNWDGEFFDTLELFLNKKLN